MDMTRRAGAEFFGTFWLTFAGCGSAVLAAVFPPALGIGFLGVALAFGLTVLTMAYAVGHRQHGQAEGERDAEEPDPERGRKYRGQHGAAAAGEGQPECAEELGAGTTGHVHDRFPFMVDGSRPDRSAACSHARFANICITLAFHRT